MSASEILQPGRLFLSRFAPPTGWLTHSPYTFVFLPPYNRTACGYLSLGSNISVFDEDNLFAPFHIESEVIAAEHVEGGWEIHDFVSLMTTLMDLGTERLVLVGADYGGQVALRYFLWQYFHKLQPFLDMAAILIGTPDGLDSIRDPFRADFLRLTQSPDDLHALAVHQNHHPMRFVDDAVRAALESQGRPNLVTMISDSYRDAAPLLTANLRGLVDFPGFEQLLRQYSARVARRTYPGRGETLSFGGRIITVNGTADQVVDVGRSVASAQRVFGRFQPVTVASGPHAWMDIHPGAYAAALIEAMVQLSRKGFGPNFGW
jgi:pimeloyl-ACP methyl ester carboxylesterase